MVEAVTLVAEQNHFVEILLIHTVVVNRNLNVGGSVKGIDNGTVCKEDCFLFLLLCNSVIHIFKAIGLAEFIFIDLEKILVADTLIWKRFIL